MWKMGMSCSLINSARNNRGLCSFQVLPRMTRETLTNHPKKDDFQGEDTEIPIILLILSLSSRKGLVRYWSFAW